MYKRGSISVFMAITFLTIVVFITSIYEITRVQVLRIEANQMLMSAGNSVLAGYDNTLKNQYGIFARNMNYEDVNFIYNGRNTIDLLYGWEDDSKITVNEDDKSKTLNGATNDFTYYLKQNLSGSELANGKIKATTAGSIISEDGYKYVEKEILDYTTLRLPVTEIANLLNSVDISVKLGKTTKFTNKKNDIIKKAGRMDGKFADIYYYADGVNVEKSITTLKLKNYVNKLYVDSENPNKVPEEMLEPEYVNISNVFDDYLSGYLMIVNNAKGLRKLYDEFEVINENNISLVNALASVNMSIVNVEASINALNDRLENCSPDSAESIENSLESKESRLSSLQEQQDDIEQSLEENSEKLEELSEKINAKLEVIDGGYKKLQDNKKIIDSLVIDTEKNTSAEDAYGVETVDDSGNSYLSNNKKVVELVDEITKDGAQIGREITDFITKEKANKDEYLSGAYDNAKRDLEEINKHCNLASDDNFDKKNNLKLMRQSASKNVEILSKVKADIEYLDKNLYASIGQKFKEQDVNKEVFDYINDNCNKSELLKLLSKNIDYETIPSRDYVDVINKVHGVVGGYKNVEGLGYDKVSKEDSIKFFEFWDALKSLYKNCKGTLSEMTLGIDGYELPDGLSSFSSSSEMEKVDINTNVDTKNPSSVDNKTAMEATSKLSSIDKIKGVGNKLLINEYAINMFKGYPDQYLSRESLSGHSIKNHAYDAELEYIATGIRNKKASIGVISSQILGIRIALNSIFLSINPQKRSEILAIANVVAGWWSLGAGTVVLSFIIGILWATLEAIIDVIMILSGKKVVLFKTSFTWITSKEGISKYALKELADMSFKISKARAKDIALNIPERVVNNIEYITNKTSEDYKEMMDETIDDIYIQANDASQAIIDEVELAVDEAIVNSIKNKQQGKAVYNSYAGSDSRIKVIVNTANNHIKNASVEDGNYESYVDLKEETKAKIKVMMEDYKEDIKNKHKKYVDKKVNDTLEYIKNEFKDYKDDAKKYIDYEFKKLEKDISKNFKDASPSGVSYYFNRFGYYDYLRIMMLTLSDKDEVVRRIVDMIDINLAYTKNKVRPASKGSLELRNYAYSINFDMEFDSYFKFIDIFRVMKDNKRAGSMLKIKANKVIGYE